MERTSWKKISVIILSQKMAILFIIWGLPSMIEDIGTWGEWLDGVWGWLTLTPTLISYILVILGILILIRPWRCLKRKNINGKSEIKRTENKDVEVASKVSNALTQQQLEILDQANYDSYHLNDRLIVRNKIILTWRLDPIMGGELQFEYKVFNGSVFPSVKVGYSINGYLMMNGSKFHDKPEIQSPVNIVHGGWSKIVMKQPLLPEVIRTIKEDANKQGGVILHFGFKGVKIYTEAKGSNIVLNPQNILSLPQVMEFRVKYEADIYSWQRLYDVNIS